MDKKWCKFCEQWLEDSPDILTVLEIKAITGYCKTSVQGQTDQTKFQSHHCLNL